LRFFTFGHLQLNLLWKKYYQMSKLTEASAANDLVIALVERDLGVEIA